MRARILALTLVPLAGFAVIGLISLAQQASVAEKLDASVRFTELGAATKAFGQEVAGLRLDLAAARSDRGEDAEKAFLGGSNIAAAAIAAAGKAAPDAATRTTLAGLAARLADARDAFKAFSALRGKIGRSEKQGQTKLFSDAANDVEATVRRTLGYFKSDEHINRMLLSLLTMRRQEKDYILTGTPRFLEQHGRELDAFNAALDQAGVEAKDRDAIRLMIKGYRDALKFWLDLVAERDAAAKKVGDSLAGLTTGADGVIRQADAGRAGASAALAAGLAGANHLVIAVILAIGLVCVAFGILVGRSISLPLVRLTEAMRRIMGGDTDIAIADSARQDEIGLIAKAVSQFRDAHVERDRLAGEREEERLVKDMRAGRIAALIDGFELAMGAELDEMLRVADQLNEAAGSLSEIVSDVRHTATEAGEVARATRENVSSASQDAGKLAASIGDISGEAMRSRSCSADVAARVAATSGTIRRLEEAAGRIGEAVEIIQSIAAHTNLLALNATIEAARAGRPARASRSSPPRSSPWRRRPPRRRRTLPARSRPSRRRRTRPCARSATSIAPWSSSPLRPPPSPRRWRSRTARCARSPPMSRRPSRMPMAARLPRALSRPPSPRPGRSSRRWTTTPKRCVAAPRSSR